MPKISVRVTGKTGQVDGYVEMLLGMFAFSGLLHDHTASKKTRDDGTTQVYLELTVSKPPLGHLGESDWPERTDDPA